MIQNNFENIVEHILEHEFELNEILTTFNSNKKVVEVINSIFAGIGKTPVSTGEVPTEKVSLIEFVRILAKTREMIYLIGHKSLIMASVI